MMRKPATQVTFANVTGTVTMDGKPLPNVHVSFYLDPEHRGSTQAPTDEKGYYQIAASSEALQGVAAGVNKVVVVPPRNSPTKVPDVYKDLLKTPLQFTVGSGEQKIDIPLKSQP